MSANTKKWVTLGRVSGVFGVKGWLKVQSYTEPHDNIATFDAWTLRRNGADHVVPVEDGRGHTGGSVVAKLRGLDDRDLAREWVGADGSTAVVESTGLSDAPLLRELVAGGATIIVRLDVTETEAIRRIGAREQGRHLTDDVEPNRRVWHAFYERAAKDFAADLVIDTESTALADTVDRILALL